MKAHDCGDCPLHPNRRTFLSQATVAVASALAALAVSTELARAMPVSFTHALGRHDDTRQYAIPEQDGVQIDREAEVILVRWQHAVYAFALSCPHQRTMLRWRPDDARFQCPKHKSKYRPDGVFIEGRATRGMDRHAITRTDDAVQVDLAVLFKQDKDPAGWDAAVVRL